MICNRHLSDSDWLEHVLTDLRLLGCAVVEGVLEPALIARTREAMYRTQTAIRAEIGDIRLAQAGELGVLRLMMRHDPVFFDYLALPPMLAVIDATLGPTAIMHLQNGFILPSLLPDETPVVAQNSFHMDFPRHLDGYLASINAFFALDEFNEIAGATRIVPGSHQRPEPPSRTAMLARAVPVNCPTGSMILFDSTLWHAAGQNGSGKDRLAINHQFTRAFLKQQMDYCRALPEAAIRALPDRSQQLLGWWTRLPASLDDYYKPPGERLYRSGQG